MYELTDMEIDRADFVRAGAVPGARVLLAKAEKLPNPGLSPVPFQPVVPTPMALADLDAVAAD